MRPRRASGRLEPTLRLWQVTVSGVGIVIGAGIYVLIGAAARDAGAAVWLSFLVAALLAGLTGLSYAELAGMFPSAGAEFEFARRALGPLAGFLAGWMMVAANVVGAGAVAIGFAAYARHFLAVDPRLASLALIAALTAVVAAGVQRSIWLTVALAAVQVGGLALVIGSGVPHLGDRSLVAGASVGGVLSAAALVFFAFIGFDEVVTLSEETRDAARVIPRALLAALAISAALYMLVGVAAVSVAGADALAASSRPLALVMADDWGGRAPDVIAVVALASTINTALLVLTAASRLVFSMARSGALPAIFATVGRRGHAPYVAAIAAGALAAAVALAGDLALVASVTDAAVYAIFLAVNGSLIALRYRAPAARRTFVVPLRWGRLPLLPCAALGTVALMLAYLDAQAWAIGAATLVAGAGAWRAYGRTRVTPAGT